MTNDQSGGSRLGRLRIRIAAAVAAIGAAASAFAAIALEDQLWLLVPLASLAAVSAAVEGYRRQMGQRSLPMGESSGPMGESSGIGLVIAFVDRDRLWAEWVGATLRAAGFSIELIDWRYLKIGRSRCVLIAGHGFATVPTAGEKLAGLSARGRKRLLVVTVDDCPLPIELKEVVKLHSDMRAEAARDAVTGAALDHGPRPAARRAASADTAVFPPADTAVFPPDDVLFHLGGRERRRGFTDRDLQLRILRTRLMGSGADAMMSRACVLQGMGGVGKTQLAVEYAWRYRAYYRTVAWIDAADTASVDRSLEALAGELGVEAADSRHRARHVWETMSSRGDWLVVFDNAEHEQDLAAIWPEPRPRRNVLVTSRSAHWTRAEPIDVPLLDPEHSIDLLCACVKSGDQDGRPEGRDREGAARVAHALDHLPLALIQAAAYVRHTRCTWLEYNDLLAERLAEMMKMKPPEDYPGNAATTWAISVERLRDHPESPPGTEHLLYLFSFLAPDDIPRALVPAHPDVLPMPLRGLAEDADAYNRAIGVLSADYSLITVKPERLSLHRLVQTFGRDSLDPEDRSAWTRAAVRLVDQAFPADVTDPANWPECARLMSHAIAVARHSGDAAVAPPEAAGLCQRTAEYLGAIRARNEAALDLIEKAVALRERLAESAPAPVAESLTTQAQILCDAGQYEAAERSARRALGIWEGLPDTDADSLVAALCVLGGALVEQGRFDGAANAYERALETQSRVHGPEDRGMAPILALLAYVQFRMSTLRTARDTFQRSLDIWEAAGGPPSPARVQATRRLGRVLGILGEIEAARACVDEAEQMAAELWDEDAVETMRTAEMKGEILALAGEVAEAERLHRRSVEYYRTRYPEPSLHYDALGHLAQTLIRAGRPDEAAESAAQAVELCPRVFYEAWVLCLLGTAQRMQGRLEEAARSLERAKSIYEEMWVADHYGLAPVLRELAAIRREQGDAEEAESLIERARDVERRSRR
ncbi:FxSxx-COOH system tetratricopeptide repeat protein [Actinomadura rudentiformis]|uniref:FxSxx-COOH system tetratricopeptide repeat protein n=1 Tax=Actinomadura rudentiformis TaxID=359158 RepID=UPI00178C63A9|nr:FxSxx-COOH system tetratricopeptide repeat protein [Actinomadura rudentiformis]